MAKLTKKRLISLSPVEISKATKKSLSVMVRQARDLYKEQAQKFDKYSGRVYSPAYDKIQTYYEEGGMRNVSSMKKVQLQAELFRLQDFFEAKTSTIPGARMNMIAQDARIFGVNEKTGKPLHRMTVQQATDYWAAYNEFKNMESESYIRNMGSNTIQQILGQMMVETFRKKSKNGVPFTAGDFRRLKQRVEKKHNEENWESGYEQWNDTVLSGKWVPDEE